MDADQIQSHAAAAQPLRHSSRAHVRHLLLTALLCGLTMVGAHLRVPLLHVPLTLQTFFVILSGMILGPFYGPLSQIAYLLLGLAGLPVFAQGGGLGYIFKPTFGYLLGYPFASGVIGWLAHGGAVEAGAKIVSTPRLVFAGAMGILAIFIPGVFVLYLNLNFVAATPISWPTALWSGFLIFLPGDVIKLAGAIAVYRVLRRFV